MTNQTDLIREVRAALEAATPGPWEVMNRRDIFTPAGATNRSGITADHNDGWHIADTLCGPTMVDGQDWELSYAESYANTDLIANSPTWLQQLTDRLEEAVKALEAITRDTVDDITEDYARATLKRIKGENG